MSKGLQLMRKFQFFDIVEGKEFIKKPVNSITQSNDEEGLKAKPNTTSTIKLSDVIPHQMYASEGVVFISGKVKKKMKEYYIQENLIVKVVNNTVIDEYKPFNKLLYSFDLKTFNEKPYFITIGGDFDKHIIDNEEQMLMITSVKIYDASRMIKNPNETHNIEQYLKKTICLLSEINTGKFILDNKIRKGLESFQNINSFAINENFSKIAVGLDRGQIIYLSAYPNVLECQSKNYKMSFLPKIEEELHITNLMFSNVYLPFIEEPQEILYATTAKNIYYYELASKPGDENIQREMNLNFEENGAYSGCIAVNNETGSLVVGSNSHTFIIEYVNLERGPSWFFEGKKQCIGYFKNYIMFILYEDKFASLAVFDRDNKFFVYYNNSFNRISGLCADENSIFAFIDGEDPSKRNFIIKLVEKDNKEKFDTFYKKNFFDLAYDYAKSLKYDKKKISEISKLHAEHAYKKGEYDKAIDQFINTINYLDPSYVIQKFLDKSKLDYLIRYLEALEKNEIFNKKDPKELQDYTALLLNCYIMQEKFQKLKEFVDNEQKTFSDSDVKTAIDVCLENKETELALFIAKKKPQMCNEYLRILIVELNKYNEAIQYMKEKQNTEEKFKLLCEFGEYLLQEKEYEDQIYNMAIDIIKAINKDKADCKVDELAKIFANKKHLLRSVVDELMKNNPDQPIIHKHIELLLESCLEEEELKKKYEAKKKEIMDKDTSTPLTPLSEEEQKKKEKDVENSEELKAEKEQYERCLKDKAKLFEIINGKEYQEKIDKIYLLMQFKVNNFTEGVNELIQVCDTKDRILLNLFDNKENDKVIQFCQKNEDPEGTFWIQALNYFSNIDNYTDSNKNDMIKYLKTVLLQLVKQEKYSPILALKALKENPHIKIEDIKEFYQKAMQIEKESYDKDKAEFEDKYNKLQKVLGEINEMKTKSTMIKPNKCATCGAQISLPAAHFLCQHSYHIACLNANTNDDSNVMECPKCKIDMLNLSKRLQNADEERKNIPKFKEDLKQNKRKFEFMASKFGSGLFKLRDPKILTS